MISKTDKLLKEFINLHPKFIDLSLSRLEYLLKKLGDPHKKLPPTIHIAGTNGKGSTLSFIKNILKNNNYSVHTYTSPHLEKFSERININNKQVNASRLLKSLEFVKKINHGRPITFFEITTAAAFLLFARFKADFLILETGLGGRLDATNIIPKKFLSIITSIGIDHEEFLGDTLKKIATEKIGIIKNTNNVIIAKQNKEIENFIFKKLKKINNIYYFNKDYKFKTIDTKKFFYQFQNIKKKFSKPSLEGDHQIENASTAITAAIVLKKNNYNIKISSLGKSICNTKWPGRIEKVKFKNKIIIFDGSHNLSGAEKLNQYLKENNIRPNIIFGMLNNKKAFEFLSIIKKNIDILYPIQIPDEKNAYTQKEIYKVAKKLNLETLIINNFNTINRLLMNSSNKYILITGSLYLIGKIRKKYL
ncbi:bifunctional folylpolyglutamate synthase/dihydrofolate synthase [Pelagibacterales bacterium SAG-MED31]|nr:bifunctional folylpolyglutamate synthase/dihydrofolate synthase [Pelagibacterales bacterium SAG-MED31]